MWNANILRPLLDFRQELLNDQRLQLDASGLLVLLIQGFCGSASLAGIGASTSPASLSLISRLGWRRAGARFRTRGVDDDGNVANLVEVGDCCLVGAARVADPCKSQSETILSMDDITMSFVQVRGSVPRECTVYCMKVLKADQCVSGQSSGSNRDCKHLGANCKSPGLVHLVSSSPPADARHTSLRRNVQPQVASQPAFGKHIMDLLAHYSAVHAVNLLGSRGEESTLSLAYDAHLNALAKTLETTEKDQAPVSLTHYDFHAAVKVNGHDVVKQDFSRQIQSLAVAQDRFGWTTIDRKRSEVVERQHGIFRTNVSGHCSFDSARAHLACVDSVSTGEL